MVEIREVRRPIWSRFDFKVVILAALCAAIFAVFIESSLSLYLGPVIALGMVYLFFNGYMELITAIIVVANDALGTILFGSISFHYLLLLMVVLNIFLEKRFSKTDLIICLVATAFALQLYAVGFLDMRTVIYSMSFVLALVNVEREEKSMTMFFRGVILAVGLIALHACVTGGVEFYELNEYSNEVIRRGILGVGIGDSNYSSFLLCIGLICLWCERKLHWSFKLVLTGMILYSLMITLSISGLLALAIILLVSVLFSKRKGKAFLIVLIVVLIAVLFFSEYVGLPEELRNETLDGYINRVMMKYESFLEGNYSALTTNRTDLAESYTNYIFEEQSVWGMLFGGNSIDALNGKIPHNTYLGVLLQFGCFGAIAFLGWVLRRAWKLFVARKPKPWGRQQYLLLKVLCLFMAMNLSFYDGSLWALWFYFLVAF